MRCHGIVRYCTAVLFQAQIALAHLMAGIHEAVEGVLDKGDRTGLQAHLHEEGALREGGGKGDEKDAENREASELVGVCRAKKTPDMVTAEKRLHFLGKLFLRLVGLCYTVHGMSLHWMFLLVLKLYQMDVAHAILLSGEIDFFKAYHGLFICEV